MAKKQYSYCINGEKYAIDLKRLREFCLVSDTEKTREQEIVENWEIDTETSKPAMVSKINREMRSPGNPQNDTILYDVIKMFLNKILECDAMNKASFEELDFSESLCFNTLLKAKIIVKIQ